MKSQKETQWIFSIFERMYNFYSNAETVSRAFNEKLGTVGTFFGFITKREF